MSDSAAVARRHFFSTAHEDLHSQLLSCCTPPGEGNRPTPMLFSHGYFTTVQPRLPSIPSRRVYHLVDFSLCASYSCSFREKRAPPGTHPRLLLDSRYFSPFCPTVAALRPTASLTLGTHQLADCCPTPIIST